MPKYIAYSLFKNSDKRRFEYLSYVRGFYFNARMNNLIYPDWRTHLEVDEETYTEFQGLFDFLVSNNNLSLVINKYEPPLCVGMLWRLKPAFQIDISHVLCRDADAVTTYREAQMVQLWLESGLSYHAIHDNPAHGGIMGGMLGVVTADLKAHTGLTSWEQLIQKQRLEAHGTDQILLNRLITRNILVHNGLLIQPSKLPVLPQVKEVMWESNLTCRHIGSPGVVEMETLRFFERRDEYNWKFQEIEKAYPKLFHWHL